MYNHIEIEKKWQKYWEENKTFETDVWDFSKPKYYILDMFPYPSGVGLHAGHPEGYTATDIVARMKRMQGYNVLHPMGYDSFGLPAEQYAIQTGNHPAKFTEKNIGIFEGQLKRLGFSYDWDRVISTSDPNYYKWTQWIFKQLYKDGLAREIEMPVNWCEELGTVLANDEVIDGKSERGGYPVIRKNMRQWVIDIPAYADKLLDGLKEIDWPESTKEMQKNWIGKSEGVEIEFKIKNSNNRFSVFTTKSDKLFGVTYCVLSPEHELINEITTDEYKNQVVNYKKSTLGKSDLERMWLNKEKTGVFTGAYAINPVSGKEIPIWIGDHVLSNNGKGATMAIPAHNEIDYEFAKKYGLNIIPVIEGGDIKNKAYLGEGKHINSGFLDGLDTIESTKKINNWLINNNIGKISTIYKIREWIFARQRYWGEPIPIVHMEDGTTKVLEDSELPLILPEMSNYKGKNGNAPLENAKEWKNVIVDGKKGVRETSTMPGSAGSSWYFIRYIDPKNKENIADPKLLKHWMPVDLYVGGPEHAVGHLLYSRMWNNYLYDKGIVPVKEPFKKLVHQGMILGSNGLKMGKRCPEYVVNPDDVEKEYGADTLRMYEMFMGPLEADKPWSNDGVVGVRRFLEKIWKLYTCDNKISEEENNNLKVLYHTTVKKVTEDYESLKFNTAIAQMMTFINAVMKEKTYPKEYAEGFLKLLNPIVPFITEEINQIIFDKEKTIANSEWPKYDEELLKSITIDIVLSVNNKKIKIINCPKDLNKEDVINYILENDKDSRDFIKELDIENIYFAPNRMINFVTQRSKVLKKDKNNRL